jgi:hypothetical protein
MLKRRAANRGRTLSRFVAGFTRSIPAASQGTMNNLTIGGIDPRTGLEFSTRNRCWWNGSTALMRWYERRPHAHDEQSEHTGGSA